MYVMVLIVFGLAVAYAVQAWSYIYNLQKAEKSELRYADSVFKEAKIKEADNLERIKSVVRTTK